MIDGMSHKEYHEFLRDVEDALYDPRDLSPSVYTEPYPDKTGALTITMYHGARHKSYSQPMMEYKEDQCAEHCFRCRGSDLWTQDADTVIRVESYPGYTKTHGIKINKPIHFNGLFAARRPHP